MSTPDDQLRQLSPTSSHVESAEAVKGSIFQAEDEEIQEERTN